MTTTSHERTGRTPGGYRAQRDGLTRLRRDMGEIAISATTPYRTVTVTVGQQGELTDVRFPTEAYKRMTPAELSAEILAATVAARAGAAVEAARLLAPMARPEDAEDVDAGRAGLTSILPAEPRTAEDVLNGLAH
ncbi:YbaB/EbfC family nucleoid-associated protein [Saccharothrix australiensis]|uniref:YbaB/EbfC DNA-binding family protein n=1 Tax=Saccharothrix australiensis TaxID=2072 RepID=A0A495W638_9PSEU|nr:YbaB/EbfC family nucleoid-associated protein [Saccharothrix australiensis]RKT56734.1 YbaB/EbfC DNA-binding family protein [Saccharothrix australiensis]